MCESGLSARHKLLMLWADNIS